MTEYTKKQCPHCGQQLRVPSKIGGMLMACPSCGNKFHSDFRLGSIGKSPPHTILTTIFEAPWRIIRHIGRFLS